MFDLDRERKIHDLMDKFGLTRTEAEGFLDKSEEWFGLKQLFHDRKLKGISILLAFLFGLIIVVWLYKKFTENK